MQRVVGVLIVSLMLACVPFSTASAWGNKEPTAIIVDAETGEPIEGAVALAQWVKRKFNFEGGLPYAAKARETVSDKEGKIYIKGYWSRNPFACERRLTVYKPGYALWNSEKEAIYLANYQPKEFSSSNNVVRLVRFEKAAAEWKKGAHTEFEKNYPRHVNYRFLGDCFELKLDTNILTIDDIFYSNEDSFLMQEKAQKRKDYEKSKKR